MWYSLAYETKKDRFQESNWGNPYVDEMIDSNQEFKNYMVETNQIKVNDKEVKND